jgi:hypothetical protein
MIKSFAKAEIYKKYSSEKQSINSEQNVQTINLVCKAGVSSGQLFIISSLDLYKLASTFCLGI